MIVVTKLLKKNEKTKYQSAEFNPSQENPHTIDIEELRRTFFESRKYKSAREIIDYLANQYYIYGPERSNFMTWRLDLSRAVNRDSTYFEEYYKNPEFNAYMDADIDAYWYNTVRVLDNIFTDITESTSYEVTERNWINEFLLVIYDSWERAKRENFKNKLANKPEKTW